MNENSADIARLEERIAGNKEIVEEKIAGTAQSTAILIEVANKERSDMDAKISSIESDLIAKLSATRSELADTNTLLTETNTKLEKMEMRHASATQVKVAIIGAISAAVVALIAFAKVYLANAP